MPNTAKNTESNALTCDWSETSTARLVQYSRRRLIGTTNASARANAAVRSAVTGTPAACRRRLNAVVTAGRSSSIVSTVNCGSGIVALTAAADQCLEPGGADHVLVL